MSNVRERTIDELVDYIRTHSQDGKLTKSMLEIAEQIGYSNATVHRSLKSLQEKGIIEIMQSKRPTEPNTIVFKGEINEVDELIARGVQLKTELLETVNNLQGYLNETQKVIRRLEGQLEKHSANQGKIISVTDIPGTDLQTITMQRSPQSSDSTLPTV